MSMHININKNGELWAHTKMRIDNARSKAKDDDAFVKLMVQRLMKITHKEKIEYAKCYLRELGYNELVEIYESKELMDILTNE